MDENCATKPPCPFGKVLVNARKERGVTQYALAKRVKRNTRHIAQIEQGKSEPRLSTIVLLADALEMDVCELVRETVVAMRETIKQDNTFKRKNERDTT